MRFLFLPSLIGAMDTRRTVVSCMETHACFSLRANRVRNRAACLMVEGQLSDIRRSGGRGPGQVSC